MVINMNDRNRRDKTGPWKPEQVVITPREVKLIREYGNIDLNNVSDDIKADIKKLDEYLETLSEGGEI